jgi:hypothetical protein
LTDNPHNRGFVYVATGTAYLPEAFKSAESLRLHHPDAAICLITDHPPAEHGPFTEIRRPVGRVRHSPMDKVLAYEAPYDDIVFLDTDTFVLDDLSPVFETLERFDLALLQDVNRGWNYQLPDVPLAFTEFNTGVIALRKSPLVAEFFETWSKAYDRLRAANGMINDQPAFRRTLFHSELRVAPLPSEFHFLGDFPNNTLWKVRLIHARGDYSRIAKQANEFLGLRAYVPELGVMPSFQGKQRFLQFLVRFLLRGLALVVRGPESVTAKHPSKWWSEERVK